MNTRVKVGGQYTLLDLSPVKTAGDLKEDDQVLCRDRHTKQLVGARVFSNLGGWVTIEISHPDGSFDYQCLHSRKLYRRVYKINQQL